MKHPETPSINNVYTEDAAALIKTWPSAFVDLLVTDPPYGNATAYVFCAAHHLGFLEHFFLRYSRFRLRELLVWDKRQVGFGTDFRRAYECILVLEKGQPRYREKHTPTLLSVPRVSTHLHPHAKPVALLERLIHTSSDPGALVLDPFAGSGSTGVAARNLGRNFIGIEVVPAYAQIAGTRLREASEAAA